MILLHPDCFAANVPSYPEALPKPIGMQLQGTVSIYAWQNDDWSETPQHQSKATFIYSTEEIAAFFESDSCRELIRHRFNKPIEYQLSADCPEYYFNKGSNNGELTTISSMSIPFYFLWLCHAESTFQKRDYRMDEAAISNTVEGSQLTVLEDRFGNPAFTVVWSRTFNNGRYSGFSTLYEWANGDAPTVILQENVSQYSEVLPWLPTKIESILYEPKQNPLPETKIIISILSINQFDSSAGMSELTRPLMKNLIRVPLGSYYDSEAQEFASLSSQSPNNRSVSLPSSKRIGPLFIWGGGAVILLALILGIYKLSH